MSGTTVVARQRALSFKVAGRVLQTWTRGEAGRDLADIAGSFRIEYLDEVRSADLLGETAPEFAAIRDRDPVEVSINGVVVLKGRVDDINLDADDSHAHCVISGRDLTGDLVDCSASPTGPGEYRQIQLETLVSNLANPYRMTVSTQVSTGAPFTLVALEPTDTVMGAIEKHSRQRGVLVTSDGVGGIVLTQAGTTRATDRLNFPGNVVRLQARISGRGRFSDIWVKGAFSNLLGPPQATLSAAAAPLSSMPSLPPAAPTRQSVEQSCTIRYGHCVDPAVRHYRPRVWLSATQSGGSVAAQQTSNPPLDATAQGLSTDSGPAPAAYHAGTRKPRRKRSKPREDADPWTLQDQADWRMRTARAQATARVYTVPSLKNAAGDLWLPNQIVSVRDVYSGLDQDMLIGAVTWSEDEHAIETRISVVDPDVYDLTGSEDHQHKGARKAAHLTARSLVGR